MKKIISIVSLVAFLATNVQASITTDTQLLDKSKPQELKLDIKMKKFNTCEDFKINVVDYLKKYYKNHPQYPILYKWGWVMMEDAVTNIPTWAPESKVTDSKKENSSADFSQTNNQVAWVDEEEIIKTDGNKIYYFNSKDNSIYVIKKLDSTKTEILKKIKLPENFSNSKIYVAWNKLAIISNDYNNWPYYARYWFHRETKSVVAVYDITNIETPKLERYFKVDGNSIDSRKIWNTLYLITNSSINVPQYLFDKDSKFLDSKASSDFSSSNIIPQKIEVKKTSKTTDQNLVLDWKKYPFNKSTWLVNDCSSIEYILPDPDNTTIDINPSFTLISTIDLLNSEKSAKTKTIFGDVGNIYMSEKSLYINSSIYTNYSFNCPAWAYCIMPYYNAWVNTLLHKLNINWDNISYANSTILEGSPLTQYSMDESGDNFRILTQYTDNIQPWESRVATKNTHLYILDKDLKLVSKLDWLGKWEDFKSSRFIWNKLYLVTFKQIDPLFVIDLTDSKNPKVLWELKIPGYSTYLHPYDENHLIGLGYDTFENKNWWTQNGWLKISLFDVSDLANPKENSSLILGDNWSYSEALYNPRMFVWNDAKKTLILPATIYTQKSKDTYGYSSAKQWTYIISINTASWITNKWFITHIDTTGAEKERNEECSKYTNIEKKCTKLLNGQEYCYSPTTYVPEYCFATSTIDEYIANNIWKYNDDFILRNLYIWENIYTVSNSMMKVSDFGAKELDKLNLAPKTQENKVIPYIK